MSGVRIEQEWWQRGDKCSRRYSIRRAVLVCAALGAGWWLAPAAVAQQVVPTPGPAAVWRASCGYCHDHGIGPVLFGRALPAAAIAAVARNGARGMPAFHASEISPAELAALAEWVNAQPAR